MNSLTDSHTGIFYCFPGCINKKLYGKWSSQGLNKHADDMSSSLTFCRAMLALIFLKKLETHFNQHNIITRSGKHRFIHSIDAVPG